ncbi:FAD/NAD-P-binding domain-containing protein [Desarmillaria tabescens]|uniref:FAD/NAD-P-binding domain-containing protein n=1 Tax=Armillaria tabescens TaxID=1929756 RepID=A0AA39NJ25_ARMTA|nr:FAD/NAD-P-binding domain-containing protein [Desarmillaria tabescens]KAK0466403.1 FAD/NAD-P-binding domain-containing protein [Desarmillaria tabescens]
MSGTLSIAIVGAGICGLTSAYNIAKTAKRTGKNADIILYDRNPAPGGTWSPSSVYDGLITNNSWKQMLLDDDGQAEKMFMDDPSVGAGPGGFRATGLGMVEVMKHVTRQVKELGAEVRCSTTVLSVTQSGGPATPWTIVSAHTDSPHSKVTEVFDKLVVATGTFSTPIVPSFATPFVLPNDTPINDPLAPFVIHTSHLSDPTVQTALYSRPRDIIVVGASKSALDTVERLALNGYHVKLILRNPPYLAPPAAKDIKTGSPADAAGAVGTRLATSQIPYFKDPVTGLRSTGGLVASLFRTILHTTWIGSFIHRNLISASKNVFSSWGCWNSPLTSDMRPVVDLMWSDSSTFPGPASLPSLIQSGQIQVVKGTVIDMSKPNLTEEKEDGFKLSIRSYEDDETVIEHVGQAVIYGTGWNTGTYPFFSPSMLDELGLPVMYTDKSSREAGFKELDAKSLNELLADQRTLADPPHIWDSPAYSARWAGRNPKQISPFRLYRLMVPLTHLEQRDVIFPGVPTCKANHVLFLVQGHWVADYLLGTLPKSLPSLEIAKKEVSMQSVWSRRLFGPAHGRLGQWLGALWIEYCGRLCLDMGVPADGMGLTGVVDSSTYHLEEKRTKRDQARGYRSI